MATRRAWRANRLRARLCSRRSARVAAWLHAKAFQRCLRRPVFGHRLRDPGAAYSEHNGEQRDPLRQRPGSSGRVAVQRSNATDRLLHQLAVAAVLLLARLQLRVRSSTSRRCHARVAYCRRAVHQALGFAAAHDTLCRSPLTRADASRAAQVGRALRPLLLEYSRSASWSAGAQADAQCACFTGPRKRSSRRHPRVGIFGAHGCVRSHRYRQRDTRPHFAATAPRSTARLLNGNSFGANGTLLCLSLSFAAKATKPKNPKPMPSH